MYIDKYETIPPTSIVHRSTTTSFSSDRANQSTSSNIASPMFQPDQVRPLAVPSPDPTAVDTTAINRAATDAACDDSQSQQAKPLSAQYLRRRRCAFCCCTCVCVTVALLGLVALILALVFKIKDPTLTMNSLRISSVNVTPGSLLIDLDLDLDLVADLSINNPNEAKFSFGNSTTTFFYKGEKIAEDQSPGGKVGRDREVRMDVTVNVKAELPDVTDTMTGNIELSSYTEIRGDVNVLGIYKRIKTITLNCTMWPDLPFRVQELNKSCIARTS